MVMRDQRVQCMKVLIFNPRCATMKSAVAEALRHKKHVSSQKNSVRARSYVYQEAGGVSSFYMAG